jgi:hypothetical protein
MTRALMACSGGKSDDPACTVRILAAAIAWPSTEMRSTRLADLQAVVVDVGRRGETCAGGAERRS